jgi:hypothetical protein
MLRARSKAWYILGMDGQGYNFARRGLAAAAVALSLLLAGCVVVPHTVASYDPHCRMVAKRMTLDAWQVASLGGCSNEGCVVLLAAAGVTAAASAVVSGSIAVIGNAVYWLERQGRCAPQDSSARASPAADA